MDKFESAKTDPHATLIKHASGLRSQEEYVRSKKVAQGELIESSVSALKQKRERKKKAKASLSFHVSSSEDEVDLPPSPVKRKRARMEAQITPAGPGDGQVLFNLILELAEYEKAKPEELSVSVEQLEKGLRGSASPPFHALLARQGTHAVGMALYFFNYSTWRGAPGLYLEDLFVTPSARKQGIGKALLRELAKIAVEKGCWRMEWVVIDWNESAQAFYRGIGAQPVEGWHVWRMERDKVVDLASIEG